jgi:putative serine protease PepD
MSRPLSSLFRLTRPAVALLLGTALLPVTPGSCQWKPFPPLPLHDPREKRESDTPPPPLPEVIANVFPSLCKIQGSLPNGTRIGGGSGFVVSPSGLIATNDHVLSALLQAGASQILAIFDDGRVYALDPLASDREADIAILKTLSPPTTVFPHLQFASSDTVVRGDTCVVLGAPLGGSLVPAVGVIGGNKHVADDDLMIRVLRSQSDWNLLQVDANMSSGSSGGPIVNDRGEVVGVSVMVQTTGGSGVGSLNYGVASDQVR